MKITLELSDAKVRGIRKYLLETSPDINPKVTNDELKKFVINETLSVLDFGAVGDYIREEEKLLSI